jgi:3',5'-nucleoside bisphosphate phosphatase
MRIDLHTHSSISDGTDRPADLVRAAAAAGLAVIGLTDHDTYDGWAEAMTAAGTSGVTVVCGVEMSTTLDGAGVHVLGYLPDPSYEPLSDELARIRADRAGRIPAIIDRLRALGAPLTLTDVLSLARNASALGRPHVADALVAKGYVRNRSEAFDRWLAEGGPAYVPKYAPPTAAAIGLITDAGGVAVLAHPWGRTSRRVLGPDRLAELATVGLAGLEVEHEDHDSASRQRLRTLAAELDLIVTGSSDYHGAGKEGHALGTNTTSPEQYQRLVDLAAAAAARAGRAGAPRPVGTGTT